MVNSKRASSSTMACSSTWPRPRLPRAAAALKPVWYIVLTHWLFSWIGWPSDDDDVTGATIIMRGPLVVVLADRPGRGGGAGDALLIALTDACAVVKDVRLPPETSTPKVPISLPTTVSSAMATPLAYDRSSRLTYEHHSKRSGERPTVSRVFLTNRMTRRC